jgi:hypothetical protein
MTIFSPKHLACTSICFILFWPSTAVSQNCEVVLQFLRLEASGEKEAANRLLVLPKEMTQFRDRPAFEGGRKPASLNDADYELVNALGALVQFELITCQTTVYGPTATIRVTRPDFLKLFPGKTGGVAITIPKNQSERQASETILKKRFGELSKVPIVSETLNVPVARTKEGDKVGVSQ